VNSIDKIYKKQCTCLSPGPHNFINMYIGIILLVQFNIYIFSQYTIFDWIIKQLMYYISPWLLVSPHCSIIHSYLILHLTASYAVFFMLADDSECI